MWGVVIIFLIVCTLTFHYLARFHVEATENENQSITDSSSINSVSKLKKIITLSLYPAYEKMDPNTKYVLMKEKYQVVKKEGETTGKITKY